jgi:hypothetical protein
MSANDFLQLPTGVIALVLVMVWPAIWAAGQMTVTLAGDVIRQTKGARSPYDPDVNRQPRTIR